MVPLALSVEIGAEQLIDGRVLIAELLLGYPVGVLERVDEDNAEAESGADQQNRDVHQV